MGEQNIEEAEDWVKKAIECDQRNGMMWNLGNNRAFYAEILKRKGDYRKSQEQMNTAIHFMKECGAGGWVERYEKELAELIN